LAQYWLKLRLNTKKGIWFMKEKLVIIDGNSLINRAFYALPLLSNTRGEFSNGVYGFANILIKAILEIKPKYIAVALDYGKKTFRNDLFKDYKGKRKPTPEELKSQFPILKKMLSAMNVTFIEKQNFEADDILGTLTKLFDTQNIIVTGDRDALQLVNDNTEIWLTKKGITEVKAINKDNFFEEYGLNPDQVTDLKALMGDPSDNIPGVAGVGEKTALELMQTYHSLDNVYKNIENVKGKLKEKLLADKDMAYLSKTLSVIKTDVPLAITLKDLEFDFPFKKQVADFFDLYDFNSLLKRTELFSGVAVDKNFEKYNANIVGIDSLETLEKQLEHIKNAGAFNFDATEEKFSFAYDKNCEFFVELSDKNGKMFEQIQAKYASNEDKNSAKSGLKMSKKAPKTSKNDSKIALLLQVFEPILEDVNIKKCLYDSKQTMHFLQNNGGFVLKGLSFDALLAHYLLVVGSQNATRENLLAHYQLSKEYPCVNLFYLQEFLTKDLEDNNLKKLYDNIEFPLIDVLFGMENVGFKINPDILKDLKSRYESETAEMEKLIKRLGFEGGENLSGSGLDNAVFQQSFLAQEKSDRPNDNAKAKIRGKNEELTEENFNVNSTKQLAVLLFDKLKLTSARNKKRSTSSDILEEMFDLHPIIPAIIRYRKIKKILTTYIEPYEHLIDPKDNLIHTYFNQTLTATGRLSSSEPNLQNIPVRDDEGRNLRKMFVTRYTDGALVSADYSQIELRLLAHLSGDEKLIDAFNHNIDIHSLTASEVFHTPIQMVTPKMRRMAKAVNFGIIYGISEFGLSQNIGTSRKEAKKYIDEYFEHYPSIKAYMDENVRKAKKSGYAYSIFNRRRKIDELLSPNYNTRQFGERVAMNMPLQGSASDIIKLAMINVEKRLEKEKLESKLILQVHDELIVDAPRKEIVTVAKILKDEMENVVKLNVPLTVQVSSGKNWFDC
jgi:DNA polymerase-1